MNEVIVMRVGNELRLNVEVLTHNMSVSRVGKKEYHTHTIESILDPDECLFLGNRTGNAVKRRLKVLSANKLFIADRGHGNPTKGVFPLIFTILSIEYSDQYGNLFYADLEEIPVGVTIYALRLIRVSKMLEEELYVLYRVYHLFFHPKIYI